MTDKQIIIDRVDVSGCEKQGKTIAGITCGNGERIRLANEIITKHKLCKDNPNCVYKQLKCKEQECEELRNKLNSNIERMNEQNEKLHNENKELKSYIKEDLVPHTQIYIGLINRIKQQMKTILMVKTNGKYRPVKNSTKEQCYQILGNIQELLKTNIMTISIKE